MRHNRSWGALLVGAVAGPMSIALGFSLLYSLGGIGMLSQGWTLQHWRAVLADTQTWISLGYSLYVAAASLALALAVGLGVALWLGPGLGRGAIRRLLFVPLSMAPVVAALAAVQMLGSTGLLARLGVALGFVAQGAVPASPIYAPEGYGIILTQAGLVAPFVVLFVDRLRANERVDALVQLALALGATRRQAIVRVFVPVILSAARATLGVYFVVLVGSFEVPLLVGAQAPATISVLVWQRFSLFDLGMRPQAHALAVLYSALTIGLLLAVQRYAGRSRVGGVD